MPKRRISTARQRQASRENLVAARAVKRRGSKPVRGIRANDKWQSKPWVQMQTVIKPHGKNTILYHRTSMKGAKQLVTHGIKARRGENRAMYFSDKLRGSAAKGFGPAAIAVRVPRKMIPRGSAAQLGLRTKRKGEKWQVNIPAEVHYQLDSRKLKGLPVKRVSTKARKRAASPRARRRV